MKIGLLDHMGYGNLGDAATQDALIAHIKTRLPDAEIVGFSLNPVDTVKRHNILCYSITNWHPGLDKAPEAGTEGGNQPSPLKSFLKKIPIVSPILLWGRNLLREVVHVVRSFKAVRTLDTLIISGGGQLCELWRGPWSHPYNVFKFSVLTRLAARKLLFVNVGAGPLNSTLSKVFIRGSVALADYVSFRDVQSQSLVHRLGVKQQTHVFPDSVYALDLPACETGNTVRVSRPMVGINPIGFCDPRIWPKKDPALYSRYLDNLAAFSVWLIRLNYQLRVYSAEASVDVYAIADLKERLLSKLSAADVDPIFMPPSQTVGDLVATMSELDFVITSKFHGVVFSHLLAKPVIAISYHNKIDDLMRTVGHSQYCLNIESFDEEGLEKAFTTLVEDAQGLKAKFRETTDRYAAALNTQFDGLFAPETLQPRSQELPSERSHAILDGSVGKP
jgi:polysaccharide pyruvyl transferase WcaK-like protein